MTPSALRKAVTLTLLVCGAILALSYAFAGFLLYRRNAPPPAPLEHAGPSAGERLARAERYLERRQIEQALVSYREALAAEPRSVKAQLGLAEGEYRAGREDVAAREYERVVRLDPANGPALLQLARIYSHQAKTWPQSETKYRQYLEHNASDAPARLELARVLAWQGKAEEAARLFALSDVSRLMTIADQRDYAFSLSKLGRWDQAEPRLKKLLAARPNDAPVKLQLASIYAGRKDWNSALPLYRSLLAEQPHDPQLNLTYGLGLLAERDYRAALPPLRRARDAMQSSGEAGLGYARALKGAHKLKNAADEFERVLPHFQRDPVIVRECADVMLEKRDYRKAAKYYGAAYGQGLRDERLLAGYAGALSGQGKYKSALPYLEEAYRRAPNSRVAFELAKVLRKLGKNEQAMELLRRVEAPSLQASNRR